MCSPAPISRANCLIINNGRCQVNFTKRCMRVHSGYACVADVLSSCMRLHHTVAYCMAVTDVVGGSKQTSFRKVSYPFARIEGVACQDCVCNRGEIESEPICPDMMQPQYQAGVRLSFGFSRSRRGTLIQDSMRLMMLFNNFSYSGKYPQPPASHYCWIYYLCTDKPLVRCNALGVGLLPAQGHPERKASPKGLPARKEMHPPGE